MKEAGFRGMRVAVLGAGRQGVAAAWDALSHGGAAGVLLVDTDPERLARAAARLAALVPGAPVETRRLDASDPAALAPALAGAGGAVSALPYRLGPVAARAALAARTHLVDLGGNTAISREILALDREARDAGVALVPDTGLAPGLVVTLVLAGMERLDEPRAARAWCGGLPERPVGPLGYRAVFSLEGLLNEYSGTATWLRDGRPVEVPALAGEETVEFPPLGTLEAFCTSGGLGTAPETLAGRLAVLEYRTLRWPGHLAKIRSFAELGLLEERPVPDGRGGTVRPRDLLLRLLAPLLDHPEVPDLVLLRVEVAGTRGGRPARVVLELHDREDPATGFTAMERCTACPATTVLEMAAAGEIAPGARPLEEAAPPGPFLSRFARRRLPLRVREDPPGGATETRP